MPYHVEVVCCDPALYSDVDAAARLHRSAQRTRGGQPEVIFSLPPERLRESAVTWQREKYSSEEVFQQLQKYREDAKGDRRYLIAVVDGPLKGTELDNIFGSHRAESGIAVITIHKFSQYVASRVYYLAFFLLRFALSFVCPGRMGHDDEPQCVLHKRRNKLALVDALYNGKICDQCNKAVEKSFNSETRQAFTGMLRYMQSQLPDRSTAHPKQHVTLIMKGGGVKGLALIGAMLELEKHYEFSGFVGTSAGAIVAALLALGRTPNELQDILRSTDFGQFADATLPQRIWNLLRHRFLHPGKGFELWFWEQVKAAHNERTRLTQLPRVRDAQKHLVTFATQANRGLVWFDSEDETTECNRLVTSAVRASMAIPGFFKAPVLDDGAVYDGGLLANFPGKEWVAKYPDRAFLGIYLGPDTVPMPVPDSPLSDVVEIVTTRDDYVFIDAHRRFVVIVDPAPIGTTDFNLSPAEAEFLVQQGRHAALKHMAWVFNDDELRQRAEESRTVADAAKKAAIAARTLRRRNRQRVTIVAIFACLLLLIMLLH